MGLRVRVPSPAIFNMDGLRKITWQDYCIKLELFHLERVANTRVLIVQGKASKEWSVRDTAREVNRSVGKVSEDLRLAQGLRIWPRLFDCPTRAEGLIYLLRKIEERERREKQKADTMIQARKEAIKWRPKQDQSILPD